MEQLPPGLIRVGEEGWEGTPHRLQPGDERREIGIDVGRYGWDITAEESIPMLVEGVGEVVLVTLHGAPPEHQP
jgi:hypothetical protein